MRIVVFAPVFVRPTETFIHDAARGLGESGETVHVLTQDQVVPVSAELPDIREVSLPGSLSRERLMAAVGRRTRLFSPERWRQRGFRKSIVRILNEVRPDVVLAHYGHGGILLHPVASRLGIPLVVSFHGADESRLGHRPEWLPRYRALFGSVALVTGPSQFILDRLVKLGCPTAKTRLLRYGIRTQRIPGRGSSEKKPDWPVRYLFVGRHTPKKDPVGLLHAFRVCLDELGHDKATLTMIGTGPLTPQVESAVRELGVGDQVSLMGHWSHDAVLRSYARHDIYVQHSVTAGDGDVEGLPVAITEALAAGLPVIATRHSGIPEVVREGVTGCLVDEHDLSRMGHRMADLARRPDARERMGAAGRKLIQGEFAFPAVQERLRLLLKSAADGS